MARRTGGRGQREEVQHVIHARPRHALALLPPGPNAVRRAQRPLPTPTSGAASYEALRGRALLPPEPAAAASPSSGAHRVIRPPHVAHFGLQGRASSPALPAAAQTLHLIPGDFNLSGRSLVLRELGRRNPWPARLNEVSLLA